MSSAVGVVGRIDPRTSLSEPRVFTISQGARVYTYYSQSSQGSASSVNSISWQPNITSPNAIFSRCFYTLITYQLDFTGGNSAGDAGPLLKIGTMDGPRFLPTVAATASVSVNINGVPIVVQMDGITPMAKYWITTGDTTDMLSCTPSMTDGYQDVAAANIYGSHRNPLGVYGETDTSVNTRAGHVGLQVVNNNVCTGAGGAAVTARVFLQVLEPIFCPPLCQKLEGPGLSQVKTLTVTFNMNPNLQRVWLHAPPLTTGGSIPNPYAANGAATTFGLGAVLAGGLIGGNSISALAVTIPGSNTSVNSISTSAAAPQLIYMAMTPQDGQALPRTLEYDFAMWTTNYYDQSTTLQPSPHYAQAANSFQTALPTNALTLGSIPDEIYVWVTERLTDKLSPSIVSISTSGTTTPTGFHINECYMRIDTLTVTFNNEVALLTSTENWDRYKYCLQNGYQGSFNDFTVYNGSVVCIRPGIDFGLGPMLAPGLAGSWNLIINVSYTNVSDQAKIPTICVCPRTFGLLRIDGGLVSQQVGVVDKAMIMSANMNKQGTYASPFALGKVGMGGAKGGDVFGSIQKFISPHVTWDNAAKLGRFAMPAIRGLARRFGLRGAGYGDDKEDAESDQKMEGGDWRQGDKNQGDELPEECGIPAETEYVQPSQVRKKRRLMEFDEQEEQQLPPRRPALKFS